MRHLKVLLTSGVVIGACLLATLPAMAATPTGAVPPTPNAIALTQIKALRQTDKELGDQLVSLRKSNQAQRKVDRAQKNAAGLNALLAAKNDRISFETTYTAARADRLNLQKDEIQLQIDRQAKNSTNITTDLNNVITDLNSQISIRKQLVTDAQTILKDLGGSVIAPTPTPIPAE